MGTQNLHLSFFSFFLLSLFLGREQVVEGSRVSPFVFRPKKLFVFGDSYVDTGNNQKVWADSWKVPYGITFPGKPTGRFSDGRVLTDFIAKFLSLKTPIAYSQRKKLGISPYYGMNFAFGGTGVFDTMSPEPNMTTQIDFFQQLLHDSVFTEWDLKNSLALVSVAGNDYQAYITLNNSAPGFQDFIKSVVSQLTVILERIHKLGVRKIAVSSLEPLGCLPFRTADSSFTHCNQTDNDLVDFHNKLLVQAVKDLNKQTNTKSFFILDIDKAFWTVLDHEAFENQLQPCCIGNSGGYSCGNVDENGKKQYTLCSDRKLKFFWDTFHPTQEGWTAVYSTKLFQQSLMQVWY
ncbi:hypothetical protein PTKIN_Ptkin06aG0056700 [Pterospermum kingtungense]